MENKNEKFSSLLDELIKNENLEYENSEYKDDIEFSKKLKNLYSTDENLEKEVYKNMKNNKNGVKVAVLTGLIVVLLSTTSFAQNFYKTIKEVFIPSRRISVTEENKNDNIKKIKEAKINYAEDSNKGLTAEIKTDEKEEWNKGNLGDIIKNETIVNPLVLGDNYKYEGAITYFDNKDKSEYINIKYSKRDKEIILFERKSTEENGYSSGSSHVEKLNIDGVNMIYSKEGSLDFEKDGLLVRISEKRADKNELVQIYKDLHLYN